MSKKAKNNENSVEFNQKNHESHAFIRPTNAAETESTNASRNNALVSRCFLIFLFLVLMALFVLCISNMAFSIYLKFILNKIQYNQTNGRKIL